MQEVIALEFVLLHNYLSFVVEIKVRLNYYPQKYCLMMSTVKGRYNLMWFHTLFPTKSISSITEKHQLHWSGPIFMDFPQTFGPSDLHLLNTSSTLTACMSPFPSSDHHRKRHATWYIIYWRKRRWRYPHDFFSQGTLKKTLLPFERPCRVLHDVTLSSTRLTCSTSSIGRVSHNSLSTDLPSLRALNFILSPYCWRTFLVVAMAFDE